jgi:hypothetical protein
VQSKTIQTIKRVVHQPDTAATQVLAQQRRDAIQLWRDKARATNSFAESSPRSVARAFAAAGPAPGMGNRLLCKCAHERERSNRHISAADNKSATGLTHRQIAGAAVP